jgi:hypothetical protein
MADQCSACSDTGWQGDCGREVEDIDPDTGCDGAGRWCARHSPDPLGDVYQNIDMACQVCGGAGGWT